MNSVETRVALAPNEFGAVETGDDEEEQGRRSLNGLHHQVGHRPDIDAADTARKVAIVDGEHDQQAHDRPKWHFRHDQADS